MVVAKESAYEESRQKRLAENKKRMEELNLNKLSKALHTPKPSPMKKVKPKLPKQPLDLSAVRRSSRVAFLPPRSYKEVVHVEAMGKPRSYKRRDLSNRVYAADEERQYAIQRAEDLQSGLDQDVPSFVKPMLQSHVTGGFWLGLPVHFCKTNLPSHDAAINLVDENEEVSETKYLAKKNGLSGGWRGFAIDHELVDGDALVFQLIEPTSFKVYIIRVNEPGDSSS
ncbi:AP2/B3-like transcriptional factor family protein [Perilla frutescens var. hirtella]|uniref:AP2/B3-like transcriptional factor family protein n=1 Tax=Perilla frutescens var. hirtella TaxID=608512 RepID=A0AAD4J2M3_PERFH|nr:AP2/B3-like transcriptional factor family protein [Perilla frutescens var. hirtella]